ncbi:MAG: hypothetical protein ACK5WQ_03550 [Alphaproteobacteria bacterium]
MKSRSSRCELHRTIVPAPFIDHNQDEVVRIAKKLAQALDVVELYSQSRR